ncbi:MAG TPA: hypothetical protein VHS55_05220 [Solirubrobacteraceae bacterium]|jgi:hypothetical protein|nr:hypothetical protein [Solirubrobacteraceae bacterium]
MLYTPIMLGQPGNPVCPDKYNEASTLICPGAKRLILQVSVQAVFVQLGLMPQGIGTGPGAVVWQTEEPYLPLIASLGRNFDAVRVRNFTPGVVAQVFITVA